VHLAQGEGLEPETETRRQCVARALFNRVIGGESTRAFSIISENCDSKVDLWPLRDQYFAVVLLSEKSDGNILVSFG